LAGRRLGVSLAHRVWGLADLGFRTGTARSGSQAQSSGPISSTTDKATKFGPSSTLADLYPSIIRSICIFTTLSLVLQVLPSPETSGHCSSRNYDRIPSKKSSKIILFHTSLSLLLLFIMHPGGFKRAHGFLALQKIRRYTEKQKEDGCEARGGVSVAHCLSGYQRYRHQKTSFAIQESSVQFAVMSSQRSMITIRSGFIPHASFLSLRKTIISEMRQDVTKVRQDAHCLIKNLLCCRLENPIHSRADLSSSKATSSFASSYHDE
jgi:hypothetical protein